MITEKLSERYLEAEKSIEEETALLSIIDQLSEKNHKLLDQVFHIFGMLSAGDPHRTHSVASNLFSQAMSEINSILKSGKTSQIFINSHKIAEALSKSEESLLKKTANEFRNFVNSLDNYLSEANINTCQELIKSALEVRISLGKIKSVSEALRPHQENQNLPTITVYTDDHTDLDEFSAKLNAFTKIVETTCNMLGMSMLEANVSIEKIESGSFFAKISANPLVIAVVTVIMTSGSQYILNQSNEKLDEVSIRERSEALLNILKIKETLEANGHPLPELDTELKSSAVMLTKQLNTLVGKSNSIEINKAEFKSNAGMLIASSQETIGTAQKPEKP